MTDEQRAAFLARANKAGPVPCGAIATNRGITMITDDERQERAYDGEPCTCKDACKADCHGECGCRACELGYADFLSSE